MCGCSTLGCYVSWGGCTKGMDPASKQLCVCLCVSQTHKSPHAVSSTACVRAYTGVLGQLWQQQQQQCVAKQQGRPQRLLPDTSCSAWC